ncbi:retrovirus-related pol polyprotein from transposon TNT 1-94, partial [Tanacetum coccineum]
HNCVACNKGKQHKASYKHISAVRLITDTLQLLHMDLFGPTNIRSIDQKYYSLVADLLTKAFDGPRFEYLVVHIGMVVNTAAGSYPSCCKGLVSAGSTMVLLVANPSSWDDDFSAGSTMILLVVILPAGCLVSAVILPAGRMVSAGCTMVLLLNKKVKGIRCDNGTEFKNAKLIELCGEKGIKRDYSNPRTPQQNGVAERKNRTLIEAARTMLADSKLPTMFWTEAVSTACYVLNRVSITNPHNKTPYELISGKVPQISHLKPFGCQVTILNTSDYLGKFEGKADDGYLVGYASNSKAYRVYNLPNKRVEETLNLRFLEDKPNVQGIGHELLMTLTILTIPLGKSKNTMFKLEAEINQGVSSAIKDFCWLDPLVQEPVALFLLMVYLLAVLLLIVILPGDSCICFHLLVKQLPDGLFISQDKYVKDMLTKFDMESVRTATTPYEAAKTKLKDETDPLLKKIFKYLKGQPKLGLWYPNDSPFQLEAYSDSDYAGSHGDRKSTTGGCQFLGRRLISCMQEADYCALPHRGQRYCLLQAAVLKGFFGFRTVADYGSILAAIVVRILPADRVSASGPWSLWFSACVRYLSFHPTARLARFLLLYYGSDLSQCLSASSVEHLSVSADVYPIRLPYLKGCWHHRAHSSNPHTVGMVVVAGRVIPNESVKVLLRDIVASFDSAIHRDHAGSFDAAVPSLVPAACVAAGSQVAYLLIYVDDIILTTSFPALLQQIIDSLHSEFDMTDLEALNYFLVQQICLYMHDPRELHFAALKCILRYVLGTLDFGLHLYASAATSQVGYTDADWAGCPSTRRSTSGYCVFFGDDLLSWSAKRQHTLSRSSAEVEYRGVANVVAETDWLRNQLRELHSPLSTATLV